MRRLVYGEWQEDRDCGEEDRLGDAGSPERDGREPGGTGELLQIPGHREVRAVVKEGKRQKCEAVNWGLFVPNVPLMIPLWIAHSSQYSPFLRAGQPSSSGKRGLLRISYTALAHQMGISACGNPVDRHL